MTMVWKTLINKAVDRYRRNRRERRENLQSRKHNIHRTTNPMVDGPARGAEGSTSVRSFVPPRGRLPFATSSMSLGGVPQEASGADSGVESLTPPPLNQSTAGSSQASQVAAPSNSSRQAESSPRKLRPWGRRRAAPSELVIPPPLPDSLGLSGGVAADTPPAITASAASNDSQADAVSTRPVDGQGDDEDEVDDDLENKKKLLEKLYSQGSYASQSEGNLGIPPVCAEMGVMDVMSVFLERSHQKDRLMRRSAIERNKSTRQNARLIVETHAYYKGIKPIGGPRPLREVAEESGPPNDEEAEGASSTTAVQSRVSVYDSLDLNQCNNEAEVRKRLALLNDHSPLLEDEQGRDLVPSPLRERANPADSRSQLSQQRQNQPESPETIETSPPPPPPPLILGKYHEHESFIISDTDDDDTDKVKKRFKKLSQFIKPKKSRNRDKGRE